MTNQYQAVTFVPRLVEKGTLLSELKFALQACGRPLMPQREIGAENARWAAAVQRIRRQPEIRYSAAAATRRCRQINQSVANKLKPIRGIPAPLTMPQPKVSYTQPDMKDEQATVP